MEFIKDIPNKIIDNPVYTLGIAGGVLILGGNYFVERYKTQVTNADGTLTAVEVKEAGEKGIMAEKTVVGGWALLAAAGFLAAVNMLQGRAISGGGAPAGL